MRIRVETKITANIVADEVLFHKSIPAEVSEANDPSGGRIGFAVEQFGDIRINEFGNADVVHSEVLEEQELRSNVNGEGKRTDVRANRAEDGADKDFRTGHRADHLSQKMNPS